MPGASQRRTKRISSSNQSSCSSRMYGVYWRRSPGTHRRAPPCTLTISSGAEASLVGGDIQAERKVHAFNCLGARVVEHREALDALDAGESRLEEVSVEEFRGEAHLVQIVWIDLAAERHA